MADSNQLAAGGGALALCINALMLRQQAIHVPLQSGLLILQIEIVPLQTPHARKSGCDALHAGDRSRCVASGLLWRCLDVVLLLAQCHALDCQPCARSKSFVASITAGEMESTASGARR